jgi:hypothetical protein
MELTFAAELWEWRGPAPYHFLTVPDEESAAIDAVAAGVTYGWGMVPVSCCIGGTTWTTSLWPKDGRYVVPVKGSVRVREGLRLGDTLTVEVRVGASRPQVRGRSAGRGRT